MFGWVTLNATPKSHPFEDRRIRVGPESDPVKIGRAVAKIQASSDNAVFDCKVLSRNHAILWYQDGDFFLCDTKSSNGTFVNNEKLAANSRDDARRVFSGDIVQLGVEIVENTNKLAYGCIYAVIQCYSHDGNLIEPNNASGDDVYTSSGTLVGSKRLFQMQQYVAEAIYREKMREEKLEELMSLLEASENASEGAWKALVNEDRLLARIEALEAQLMVCSNNNNPDKQKEELLAMIDEKTKFEALSKENIRRLQEELGETISRLRDTERSLDSSETACNLLKTGNAELERMLNDLTEILEQKKSELETAWLVAEEAQKSLTEIDQKHKVLHKEYMKVTHDVDINEISRSLSNELNRGSKIDGPDLFVLLDAMANANYLADDAYTNYLKPNRVQYDENNEAIENKHVERSSESYLKEILTHQGEIIQKIRDLETELATMKDLMTTNDIESKRELITTFKLDAESSEKGTSIDTVLELSPTENFSFIPEKMTDNKIIAVDRVAQLLFLFSLMPFFTLILTIFAPIHNKLVAKKDEKKSE